MNPPKDLSGQRYGRLVVLESTPERDSSRSIIWKCKCDCGNYALVSSRGLLRGRTKSCGCIRREKLSALSRNDLSGQRFGKLLVKCPTEQRRQGSVMWECLCDCGNTVFIQTNNLTSGNSTSCGCQKRKVAAERMLDKAAVDCVQSTRLTALNETLFKSNTSGIRGVYHVKKYDRWIAQITFKGKTYHLGYFSNIQMAITARKIAEEELWHPLLEEHIGEFQNEEERKIKLQQYLKRKIEEYSNNLKCENSKVL